MQSSVFLDRVTHDFARADVEESWQRARVNPMEIYRSLPSEADAVLFRLITSYDSGDFIDSPPAIPAQLRQVMAEHAECLVNGTGALIVRMRDGLTASQRQKGIWILAHCLGELLVQDSQGNRLIHVYDRDRLRRMSDGARYHQTREGGSLHTDNVNAPDPWEFLVFGCVVPALIGGESVLVHGELVHRRLEQVAPEALEILRQPFHWEYRGIADALYQAPIITYDPQHRPHFRYLRPYLESAHHKAGEPLTERQSWALDVLDSALELGELQLRLTLQAGDVLITHDSRILHGRTSFADHFQTTTVADSELHPQLRIRRSYERAWVRGDSALHGQRRSSPVV